MDVPLDPSEDSKYIEWCTKTRSKHPHWKHGTTLWTKPFNDNMNFNRTPPKPALIIGNGPSRKSTLAPRLMVLDGLCTTYGCNALYRDFAPDFLFTNDCEMMFEIIEAEYKGTCVFADYEPLPIECLFDILREMGINGGTPNSEGAYKPVAREFGNRAECKEFIPITAHDGICVVYLSDELKHIEWGYKFYKFGQSTGLLALQRALENGHVDIEMHGFDGLRGDGYKNVYDGTDCYKFDPRKKDGVRNPDDYVPIAADDWSKIYSELRELYPKVNIKLM